MAKVAQKIARTPTLNMQKGEGLVKKKRRRCGKCAPCLTKKSCGECKECINRKTGHQICTLRKCIFLKKIRKGSIEEFVNDGKSLLPEIEMLDSGKRCVLKLQHSPIGNEGKDNNHIELPNLKINNGRTEETTRAYQRMDSKKSTAAEVGIDIGGEYPFQPKANKRKQSKVQDEFEPKPCNCKVESMSSVPFYNQLGSGSNLKVLREMLEKRFCVERNSLRIERVIETKKEGKNLQGCPIAKWVLRRSNSIEKILVLVKERKGHVCDDAVIVISIVIWEGITMNKASCLYQKLTYLLSEHATMVTRRCGRNEKKNCRCQGDDPATCGASFSFGCSWSMYYNGCKFGNSTSPRKFKIGNRQKEDELQNLLENLATEFSPKCKMYAPKAYNNMTFHEDVGSQCRIGYGNGRPFSGMTCCLDFCAHSHKDLHNVNYGTTMVLTLLKKGFSTNADISDASNFDENADDENEQLHVLPFYQLLRDNGSISETNYRIPKHTLKSKISSHDEKCHNSTRKNWNRKTEKKEKPEYMRGLMKKSKDSDATIKREKGNLAEGTNKITDGNINLANNRQPYDEYISGEEFKREGSVSYIDEKTVPLMFSESKQGFMERKPVFMPKDEFIPKRPRLRLVDDLDPFMYRQQVPSLQFRMNSDCEKDRFFNDQDLRKRLGYKGINDEELYPYVREGGEEWQKHVARPLKEDEFVSKDMGGVSIALSHGSILFECAKKEVHATTAVKNPKRLQPTRLSIIFYQHKHLNAPKHGYDLNRKKMMEKLKKNKHQVDNLSGCNYAVGKLKRDTLSDLELLAEAAFMKYPNTEGQEDMIKDETNHVNYDLEQSVNWTMLASNNDKTDDFVKEQKDNKQPYSMYHLHHQQNYWPIAQKEQHCINQQQNICLSSKEQQQMQLNWMKDEYYWCQPPQQQQRLGNQSINWLLSASMKQTDHSLIMPNMCDWLSRNLPHSNILNGERKNEKEAKSRNDQMSSEKNNGSQLNGSYKATSSFVNSLEGNQSGNYNNDRSHGSEHMIAGNSLIQSYFSKDEEYNTISKVGSNDISSRRSFLLPSAHNVQEYGAVYSNILGKEMGERRFQGINWQHELADPSEDRMTNNFIVNEVHLSNFQESKITSEYLSQDTRRLGTNYFAEQHDVRITKACNFRKSDKNVLLDMDHTRNTDGSSCSFGYPTQKFI